MYNAPEKEKILVGDHESPKRGVLSGDTLSPQNQFHYLKVKTE